MRRNERIYCEPGRGFFADRGNGSSPAGPFNTSMAAEEYLRPTPPEGPLGVITADDVQRVAAFAQDEAAHQDEEAEDVEGSPHRWAEASDADFEAAEGEADEIRDDARRVEAVASLIHARAGVVAAILAADERLLRGVAWLLGAPAQEPREWRYRRALARLVECPDLNLDSLEPETIEALAEARALLEPGVK